MIISIHLQNVEAPTSNRSTLKVATYSYANLKNTKPIALCIERGSLTNMLFIRSNPWFQFWNKKLERNIIHFIYIYIYFVFKFWIMKPNIIFNNIIMRILPRLFLLITSSVDDQMRHHCKYYKYYKNEMQQVFNHIHEHPSSS